MIRQVVAASGALIASVAFPLVPQAAADDGQLVTFQGSDGTLNCLVSADNVPRGGGPMVVCQRADGAGFGPAPFSAEKIGQSLNLAVERGTGEFNWDKGSIAGPGTTGMVLSSGQTYHIDGWTIQPDDLRVRFTYDNSRHGMLINAVYARGF